MLNWWYIYWPLDFRRLPNAATTSRLASSHGSSNIFYDPDCLMLAAIICHGPEQGQVAHPLTACALCSTWQSKLLSVMYCRPCCRSAMAATQQTVAAQCCTLPELTTNCDVDQDSCSWWQRPCGCHVLYQVDTEVTEQFSVKSHPRYRYRLLLMIKIN